MHITIHSHSLIHTNTHTFALHMRLLNLIIVLKYENEIETMNDFIMRNDIDKNEKNMNHNTAQIQSFIFSCMLLCHE